MVRRHHADKKRLPGILKREAATRQQMFKQSLRISMITSPEEEKEKVKQVRWPAKHHRAQSATI